MPRYCSGVDLTIPRLSEPVVRWLQEHDADALETMRMVGLPTDWQLRFAARAEPAVTASLSTWAPEGGGVLGTCCLVGLEPLRDLAAVRDWAIASDGRFVLCQDSAVEVIDDRPVVVPRDVVHQFNSSCSAFLVFATALDRLPPDDERAMLATAPRLAEVDAWAFTAPESPWPRVFAERTYGDLLESTKREEMARIVAAALGG